MGGKKGRERGERKERRGKKKKRKKGHNKIKRCGGHKKGYGRQKNIFWEAFQVEFGKFFNRRNNIYQRLVKDLFLWR